MPVLSALQDALWQDLRVLLIYRRSDSQLVERIVDPLGLVAKRNLWYLIASVDGEIRTYRISRTGDVQLTSGRCVRPPGFDLAEYWARSSLEFIAGLPKYPAVLRISPAIISRLRFVERFSRVESLEAPDADGWSMAKVQFETLEEASEYALGFGPDLEVLEPGELRARVALRARQVADFYAGRTSISLTG